jgi:hypothetical protein
MGFTDYWENLILQHVFNVSKGVTSELYVGLSSSEPMDDVSGVSEPPAAKGYARVKTSLPGGTSWELISGVTVRNAVDVDFPRASVDWGILNYFGLWNDKVSGASLCAYGALDSGVLIQLGDNLRFPAGQLLIVMRPSSHIRLLAGTVIGITKAALPQLQTMRNMVSLVTSKTLISVILQSKFAWENSSDFNWADDGGFNWEST